VGGPGSMRRSPNSRRLPRHAPMRHHHSQSVPAVAVAPDTRSAPLKRGCGA
jgi:hypothetical protein